jgi:hypothetical protein
MGTESSSLTEESGPASQAEYGNSIQRSLQRVDDMLELPESRVGEMDRDPFIGSPLFRKENGYSY